MLYKGFWDTGYEAESILWKKIYSTTKNHSSRYKGCLGLLFTLQAHCLKILCCHSLTLSITSPLQSMKWATTWQKVSLGVSDQARHKPACTATEASQSLEISAIESRDIILFKQQTTKALIRLHECTGWSAPLLVAYDIRHIFSWPGSNKISNFLKKESVD